jgi:hypothetical protein
MDTIKKYQDAIMSILEDFASRPFSYTPTVEKQIIADKERNRFMVVGFGWEEPEKLSYSTFLHFAIINGKVWVQQNWTEIPVAKRLMEQGVPQSDIVLGFVPEFYRGETEYAVA